MNPEFYDTRLCLIITVGLFAIGFWIMAISFLIDW